MYDEKKEQSEELIEEVEGLDVYETADFRPTEPTVFVD